MKQDIYRLLARLLNFTKWSRKEKIKHKSLRIWKLFSNIEYKVTFKGFNEFGKSDIFMKMVSLSFWNFTSILQCIVVYCVQIWDWFDKYWLRYSRSKLPIVFDDSLLAYFMTVKINVDIMFIKNVMHSNEVLFTDGLLIICATSLSHYNCINSRWHARD